MTTPSRNHVLDIEQTTPEGNHPLSTPANSSLSHTDLSQIRALGLAEVGAKAILPSLTLTEHQPTIKSPTDHPATASALVGGPPRAVSPSDQGYGPPAMPAHEEEHGISGFFHKAAAVAEDVGGGVVDEVEHHPLKLLEDAAIGAGVAIGASLLAPEIAIGLTVAGVAAGVYEVAKNAGTWAHAADVVANPNSYSLQEQQSAHAELHGVGQGVAQLGAGIAGGYAGSIGLKVLEGALADQVGVAAGADGITGSGGGGAEAEASQRAVSAEAEASEQAPKALAPQEGIVGQEEVAQINPVQVEAPNALDRTYSVGDQDYQLKRFSPNDAWFYGKYPAGGPDGVGSVKLHVTIDSAEDLADVQKALIPYLNDDPVASKLAAGWKTFDPKFGFGEGEPSWFAPGENGENAKGFTIYTRTADDALQLQEQIDGQLDRQGLSLEQPYDTGNVDAIVGDTNRVGVVRDYYPVTSDAAGNVGARLDSQLAEKITGQYGGGQLSPSQLTLVEESAGIKDGSLGYDKSGNLMLKLQNLSHGQQGGQIYATENGASTTLGDLTDRPAMYALARAFGWNLAYGDLLIW